MSTSPTKTLAVTINAPFEQIARDLAEPSAHAQWGTEFFQGDPRPGENGAVILFSPFMKTDV
ncbi:MAG: hypothetical protein GY762_00715 [Proteobacteria bacterium]|nr:hypothetical protein [Pseudomonadota bacterium]